MKLLKRGGRKKTPNGLIFRERHSLHMTMEAALEKKACQHSERQAGNGEVGWRHWGLRDSQIQQ